LLGLGYSVLNEFNEPEFSEQNFDSAFYRRMQYTHISCIIHKHLLLSLAQENVVTYTAWLDSLSRDNGWGKMYRFYQKHGFLFLHDLLYTGRHLLGVSLLTNLNSNVCTAIITYNTAEETVFSHTHWIQVHFNLMFLMKHTCYWSRRRDIQRSLKQTTSKVICKPFSQLQYIEQMEITVKLLTYENEISILTFNEAAALFNKIFPGW
jgi:hypothetical protein